MLYYWTANVRIKIESLIKKTPTSLTTSYGDTISRSRIILLQPPKRLSTASTNPENIPPSFATYPILIP